MLPQAFPTAVAPLSSALFLAIANTSKLGVPFSKAWAIVSVPSGPILKRNLYLSIINKYF